MEELGIIQCKDSSEERSGCSKSMVKQGDDQVMEMESHNHNWSIGEISIKDLGSITLA